MSDTQMMTCDSTRTARVECFRPSETARPLTDKTGPRLSVIDMAVRVRQPERFVPVIEAINFQIYPGEWLAMVGESGSGKSVLCGSLMGTISPALAIDGLIIGPSGLPQHGGRGPIPGLAMIFQNPTQCLNPVRSIGFHLKEMIGLNDGVWGGEAKRIAKDLLDKVGIQNPLSVLEKYPYELSGGMNQRIMIALALCSRPQVLIADEPTSALDVTTQRQILDLIDDLRRTTGMSILFVTHDLGAVAERADSIGVLYAGRLAEFGPASAVAETPRHPYTQALFRSIPRFQHGVEVLATVEGNVPDPSQRRQGCSFSPRCSYSTDICRQTVPQLDASQIHDAACFNEITYPCAR